MINIIGIEASCDETAVAVLNDKKEIIFHELWSQDHKQYGGVFPEHAARNHIIKLQSIVKKSFEYINPCKLTAISATAGPGLIGGLIVGTTFAKGLAYALNKPFIAVNHLEGHALVTRFNYDLDFPFLLLLISGGHSEILIVHNVGQYTKLGGTLDDSVGETFDKVAKMMGLQYPGGPIIEKMANFGNKNRFNFPMPLCCNKNLNFSFSGLKTFVHNTIKKISIITENDICDISASLQECIANILLYKLKAAFSMLKTLSIKCKNLVISGGVASNHYIRNKINNLSKEHNIGFIAPPIDLCTDNGIMIAWAAMERFMLNMIDDLSFEPRAKWDLSNVDRIL